MEGNCEMAVEAIADLGEGDLGRVKGFLLERHARRCGRCASYLRRMGAVVDGLAGLGRVYAPDDLLEAVMTCLATGDDGDVEQSAVEKHGRRNLLLVVGAAGLGVGAAIGLAIARWVLGRERSEALATVSSG